MPPKSRIRIIMLVILVAACIFYYRYEMTPNPKFDILQMTLDNFKHEYLFEKSPIIFSDKIVNPLDLLNTVFRFLYFSKRFRTIDRTKDIEQGQEQPPHTTKSKYTILSSDTNTTLTLMHPSQERFAQPVDILLGEHQIIIIPRKWKYIVEKGKLVNVIELGWI